MSAWKYVDVSPILLLSMAVVIAASVASFLIGAPPWLLRVAALACLLGVVAGVGYWLWTCH